MLQTFPNQNFDSICISFRTAFPESLIFYVSNLFVKEIVKYRKVLQSSRKCSPETAVIHNSVLLKLVSSALPRNL